MQSSQRTQDSKKRDFILDAMRESKMLVFTTWATMSFEGKGYAG